MSKKHDTVPPEAKWDGDEGERDQIESDPNFNEMSREMSDKHWKENNPAFHAMMKRVQGAAK